MAIGMTALLGGIAALSLLSVEVLIAVAAWLAGIGMLLGVPTGIVYHIRLYQELKPEGDDRRQFLWHPIKLHERLDDEQLGRVLPWCIAGAAGFVIVVLSILAGCVAVARLWIAY